MSDETTKAILETSSDDRVSDSYHDETIIWQGRPSQWVNLGAFLWWGAVLAGAAVFLLLWNAGLKNDYASSLGNAVYWIAVTLAVFAMTNLAYSVLSVYCETTVITQNRIKEAKGITRIFRQELFCEISDIKDIVSPPAGFLGLVGLSSLVIETNDRDQPTIRVRAIRNREQLIEKLLPVWRKMKIERKGYFGDR